jgi:polysaccharide deacetylase 2 family uncharacterized protein YibQ
MNRPNGGMAAASSADATPQPASVRALAFAASFTVCLLAAGALAITLFGRHSAPPSVSLDLPPLPQARPVRAASAAPALPEDPMPPVTKVLHAGSALLADPALAENTPLGPLPRVAEDGRKPMTAYAAPAPAGRYRIAIVVNGLGQSAAATRAALDGLPGGVTLAFAPYAADAGTWAAQARARGHEVLLEIPMEPFDFPDSDPGPQTLRTGQDQDANIQRLDWALSRFTGYAGVTNFLGQRFLSDADALAPVLSALNRRGLYFFDNGSAAQSVTPMVAGQAGMPMAQSGPAIDTVPTGLEIDRRLTELETQARANGSAVGSAFLYPVSIARIAAWAKGLRSRGFVLVPVSAIVNTPGQQSASR